jgi:hypothetical protein
MQFTDDEQIYSVSTDTNRKLITRLETTISELQSALKATTDFIKEKGFGDAPEVAGACIMMERAALNGTIARVLKDIVVILHRMGYCCCGQDRGKPLIATFCPKHGATVLNSGGALEYPLDDAHAHVHLPCDRLQLPPICRRLPRLSRSPSPTGETSTIRVISLGWDVQSFTLGVLSALSDLPRADAAVFRGSPAVTDQIQTEAREAGYTSTFKGPEMVWFRPKK